MQCTMQQTLQYSVLKVRVSSLVKYMQELVRLLPLLPASRGLIYVRSDMERESIAKAIDCPFYKNTATDEHELRKWWDFSRGGWVIATSSPWTSTYLLGATYIIHLGRPYGLTAFMQQVGQGAGAGEISDSLVILPSSGSGSGKFDTPQQELVNAYLVEAQDEAALTKYLESDGCRRAVLAKHLDRDIEGADCLTTDSILCDRCQELVKQSSSHSEKSSGSGSQDESSVEAIHQALQLNIQQDEQLEGFH
jgi:hypothetical protein